MNDPLHPHNFTQHPIPTSSHLFPATQGPGFASQHGLGSLDYDPFAPDLDAPPDLSNPFDTSPPQYDARSAPRFHEIRPNAPPINPFHPPLQPPTHGTHFGALPPRPAPRQQQQQQQPQPQQQQHESVGSGGQFGVLTLHPQHLDQGHPHNGGLEGLSNDLALRPTTATGGDTDRHFSNMKIVPDPPNLDVWRQRLFDVDDPINLTEEEFQTYFPHVDNIYSHRSTQKYKRKPFVSHYWDCRLKGRPPGTAKSDDPNKKKRKRTARERDLCDVKIKITEYFPQRPRAIEDNPHLTEDPANTNPFAPAPSMHGQQASISDDILDPDGSGFAEHLGVPGSDGARYYIIQRVNGNGANGKEGISTGGHKHTLENSDKVKRNSIARFYLKEEKERKKSQKTYHKKATGTALSTVKKHSKDNDLKLFGSCFCPFVQRVWISLELKGLSYQYIEVDPYKKPDQLMDINPRGLIPALKHGNWGCYESSVLMEYLEDLNAGLPLLPQGDAKSRAHCRLWADHINRKVLPKFYGLLQAQETEEQVEQAQELRTEIGTIVDAADPSGPFFLGPHISFVDVQIAPWIIRLKRVLTPYRDWPAPEPGSRWARWVDAIEGNEGVRSTTSTDDLYIDSYERYAVMFSFGMLENRPDTSQVAKAINAGGGLP